MKSCDLHKKHCLPCEGGVSPLTALEVEERLKCLHADWKLDGTLPEISRDYRFHDYYHTMAFVNAIAWMAHQENHHPDLEVGYNHCCVRYTTHAVRGLSENDFICALKVDALLDL